ncbi:unnamed protein product [Musa acuminata subsp. malaccensis]|uniref:(wild Malaysian banana) hypothetical protein n=1 Tax=Musa acuminata subsp. malaccensis TaxID=214687 RepID=A0A804J323_MUSAM|nr:PREDICTED: probable protein arginine N-methyltransferase 6.2 isoform X1 [Musa acuminata subsp. malaccensis]CAG1838117.1 unnamed protein product [Musa acuminata subsp. malaccensis]
MTVEDDSASRPWFAACRGSRKRKRSTDAVLQQRQASPVVPPSSDIEEYYSRAYSQIKDHARMEAYRDGILRHQPLISGKVVLNIGCGTGILAIFCALAGATRVYAIDESALAVRVGEVVKENNLSDRMTVLLGRVEDVSIDEKVDVIISDWMGDMLLHKSMLPSIIFARDKWLKPGGFIFPSHASLYMALFTDADGYHESIDFWHDVYGINMSAVLPLAKTSAFGDTYTETISKASVLTLPILVKQVDCYTITIQDFESVTNFSVSSLLQAPLHGFAFWFDVSFSGSATYSPNHHLQLLPEISADRQAQGSSHSHWEQVPGEILLSTAPGEAPTHWEQTVLYLYDPIELKQDQKMVGSVSLSLITENCWLLDIHLAHSTGGLAHIETTIML